ncbi:S-layer homology domain-containing protein [Butyricicoccus pullicaecorum]|nr:S-layer homology domain-containing protein [Butyricicoccus pullicaecorum]
MYRKIVTTETDTSNIKTSGDDQNAVVLESKPLEITKPVTISVPVPESFATNETVYVRHIKDDGKEYIYEGKVKNGVLTFVNPHGFSEFIVGVAAPVAKIGEIGYPTLQSAIDEVEDNGTIEVLANDLSATVRGRKTFTLTGAGAETAKLSAASGYRLSKDGNTYTVSKKSSGSSSDSSSEKTYSVSAEKSKNGTVKLSDAKAVKGDTVTITVKPDDGYVLDTLTVIDADGDEVKLKDKGDGKYTFTMPASKITVEATFVLASEVEQPTQPTTHLFADIAAGSWIDTAVQYVYANGLMTGVSETEFAPSAATSRAMIWTILARRSGADTTGGANWYEKGQQWAIENGISDGSNPSGSITREQLAVMLWRTVGCPLGAGDLSAFTDANTISDYAVTAMQWAIETGLMTGNGSGTLAPKAGATRAETAAMLMRFCEANQ